MVRSPAPAKPVKAAAPGRPKDLEKGAAILEAALDCIITIDDRGRVLEFNPAAEETFGYSAEDVVGREMWLLDEADNIHHADELWPSIADQGWRVASLEAWTVKKVPWYRDGKGLMARWREKHPGQVLAYDTGGTLKNLVLKYPGWRAREGFGQERLGVPGEEDDPLAGN